MSIHIEGRRWFQRTYGNTYNTVRIFKDGEYFLQRAFDWLGHYGMPELLEKHANGVPANYGTQYLFQS